MDRRAFLAAAGATGLAATAGCLASGAFDTTNSRAPPLVRPRPEGVYVPTHTEAMGTVGTGSLGDLRVRVAYSYPHRFWTVERDGDGYRAQEVAVEADDAVHLMATPFDPETGQVIPDTGLAAEVYRDGDLVTQEVIYRMLSQRMGFHYGANFPLEGDGTYEVRISVAGVDVPRYGSFAGRFEAPGTASVAFEYSERARNDLPYELLPDRQGETGALSAMEMAGGRAPDLPGDPLGSGRVDDARLVAARVSDDRFGDDPYLAVSARTPYHGYVIPRMRVSAAVPDASFEDVLAPALDPDLGFHYGAVVPALSADSTVTAAVEVPSTVARHEGYETAFLGTGRVDLTR
jgi:uncharacterized protein involved in high-affinity Fe2+ transport